MSMPPRAAAIAAGLVGVVGVSATAAKQCELAHAFDDTGWHLKVSLSNEGGTCSTDLSFLYRGQSGSGPIRFTPSYISPPPQHGVAKQVFDPVAPTLQYTPVAGYVGADQFRIHVPQSSQMYFVDVTVGP